MNGTVRRGSGPSPQDQGVVGSAAEEATTMKKTLLLLASLGSFGILGQSAGAGDHGPGQLRPPASFGVRIFVHPAPKVLRHHHHPGAWQLRPQPVFRFGDPRPIRHFGHPWPRPLVGHRPPRPHFGHLFPRPHVAHLPPRLHFWHKTPHSGWRQPWDRLPHHVVRPPHRDHSWRHRERRWDSWPRRDFGDRHGQHRFADRDWQHRRGDHSRHREWRKGPDRHHVGHKGRRH
jgi:hypothetical protein